MARSSLKLIQTLHRSFLPTPPSKPQFPPPTSLSNPPSSHISSSPNPLSPIKPQTPTPQYAPLKTPPFSLPNPRFSNSIMSNPQITLAFLRKFTPHFPSPNPILPLGIVGRAFCSGTSSGPGKFFASPLLSRFPAFGPSKIGGGGGGFGKSLVDGPLSAIQSGIARYRDAVSLQVEAFLERNSRVLVGVGGAGLCLLLWRIMYAIGSVGGVSDGMAKYWSLAAAAMTVSFAGLYVRSRFTINPDRIYRMALTKLNMSAGILEVMGTPLKGTDLRACVMFGGVRLKKFKFRVGKRCFLIFPIRGSQRNGLVSVEVKKKKGMQYDMKILAVDIPMASGSDQRLFMIGDEEKYQVGDGLISELRDPLVKAMAARKEFDDLDKMEEEEDAGREQEAE